MGKRLFQRITKPEALPLLAFFIPFIIRAIPELLMGPYLVGFDTIGYYLPNTLVWLHEGVAFWSLMAEAPFLYSILMVATSIGVPIVISLKVMSISLLGFLGLVVFFYANKTLSWSPKKSLLAVLFATLYFVALRVSWDMLKSEVALIFLFVTLIFLRKDGNPWRNGVLLSLAMVAVVFAHPLIAVIMFTIVLGTIIRLYLDKEIISIRRLVVCSVPAAVLFLLTLYANYAASSQFSVLGGFLSQTSGGFKMLFGFGSYTDVVINTLEFLVFCYLPLLPLVILGVKRFGHNLQLNAWVFCVSIALILAVVDVFIAVLPYRWILLLAYPLAFYAAQGFSGLRSNRYKAGVGLMLATLSVGFMVMPNNLAFPYFVVFPLYVPTSMLQNTVSLSDCQDTVNVLQWTKTNMNDNTRLLVHRAFYGWASLTIDSDKLILYEYDDPAVIAQEIMENGAGYQLYLLWWVNGSGWYGQPTVSSAFGEELYKSGRMAVFMYNYSVSP
jgi:hypothetical protein